MNLTRHHKQILIALTALLCGKPKPGWFYRTEIGHAIWGNGNGVNPRIMQKLWNAGLVEPRSEAAAHLVLNRECRCGCDQWCVTSKGMETVKGINVHFAKPEAP